MKRAIPIRFATALFLSALAACSQPGSAAFPVQEAASPTLLFTHTQQVTSTPTSTSEAKPSPTTSLTPIPSPTSTQTPLACWQSGGRIETHQLEADWLRYPLDVRIYLPPCYDDQPDRIYPVLYLFHGQSYTDDQWQRLGAVAAADRLIAQGETAPFLIVMPHDREWTASNLDPLGHSFTELLLPWVDKNYRTLPERRGRAVGGLSRGAGWAVHFGLEYYRDFSAIGAHSPALFWNDGLSILKWLDEIPSAEMPRIWIDLGSNDAKEIKDSATWLESQLTQRDIPHEWYLNTGFHDEKYWSSHVEQYLRWYTEDW